MSFPPIRALVCFKDWIVQNPQVWRRALAQMPAWWTCRSQFTDRQRKGTSWGSDVLHCIRVSAVQRFFRERVNAILVSGQNPPNKTQPTHQLFPPPPQYNSKLCNVSELIINMDCKWYFPSPPPPFLSKPSLMPGWGEEYRTSVYTVD